MSDIRLYVINGWQFLGYQMNGQLFLVTRLGRAFEGVRP